MKVSGLRKMSLWQYAEVVSTTKANGLKKMMNLEDVDLAHTKVKRQKPMLKITCFLH
jgi:hypothetical protein